MNKRLLLCFLLMGSFTLLEAQVKNNLETGWENFHRNKRDEARKYFSMAVNDEKFKSEAHLGLSLLASIDKTPDESFNEFVNFFNSSPDPYPYTFALWTTPSVLNSYGKKTAEKVSFLTRIASDPKANGTMQAMAHFMLGNHFEHSVVPKKSSEEYARIGAIDQWQAVGEFENISGSGFDKKFDPIKNPDGEAVFKNKKNAAVKWFDLPSIRNDKWVDFDYHFLFGNSIIYAQTFVNSPAEQEVQLRIGVSGSVKVWMNDLEVLSVPEERNNDLDTYISTIKLNKGHNRLLVQIGESEAGKSNFMARITDENGNNISGLSFTKKPQPYSVEYNYKPKEQEHFAEAFFREKIKQGPKNVLNHLMLAQAYLRNDKAYEARKALTEAEKLEPASSYIKDKLADVYLRDQNRTDYLTILEWLKDNDGNNPISLNLFYNEEVSKESYASASDILTKMEGLFSDSEDIFLKKIQLSAKNNKQEEMLRLIEEAYSRFPDNSSFVELKFLVEKNVKKNIKAARKVLEEYTKKNYSIDGMQTLAGLYFDAGEVSKGLDLYKHILTLYPVSVGIHYKLGLIYFQLQQYPQAEASLKNAIALAPYLGSYWRNLAKIYAEQKNPGKAREAYNKALEYDPTDYTSRKELRELEKQPEIYSAFEQPDVYDIYKKSPAASDYKDENSLVLHDEVQKVVYKGGASEEKHIILVKVFNNTAIESWKEYYIDYHNMQRLIIEKAETLKPDGSKIPAESSNSNIVFTSLEPGDAVHITYRIENYLTGKLAPHFWDRHYFSYFYPYLKSKYSLLIDPGIAFKYKFSSDEIPVQKKQVNENDLYVWEKTNQPRIKSEDKMPVLADLGQILYLSSFPDWDYISEWYYDIASTKAKSSFEVKEAVAGIFENKNNLSEIDKVKEIYNYVINNIRYSSIPFRQSGLIPQDPAKVLNTRLGDCKDVSTLFVAMAKEAGVSASLVLVNTRNNGINDMLLPSIDFNHCIAKVNMNEKDYYIELTSDYLPFSSIYPSVVNSRILEVSPEKKNQELTFLNPPGRNLNTVNRKTGITIAGENIVVSKDNVKTAAMAALMRSSYRDLSPQEREKDILAAVSGEYPEVVLKSVTFNGLEETSDTLKYTYSYTANNAVTTVGGLQLFSLPWASKANSRDFIFEENRQHPIDLWHCRYDEDADTETITINVPADMALAEIPKTIQYTCSIADYTLHFDVSAANQVMVTRNLKFKETTIPVDKIKEFSEFYKKVIAADGKQIALKNL